MLTFYINRAGKTLPKTQRDRLKRAKTELKQQFGENNLQARVSQGVVTELPLTPREYWP